MKTEIRNRIDEMFERCRSENRAALILYLTGGFPSPDLTPEILDILATSGCDLIEFGIPFSDPIADGPTIQKASTKALLAGMSLKSGFRMIRDFRSRHDTPVLLFGSINPFLVHGLEKSAQTAEETGCDGFLAADLPTEESDEFREICSNHNQHLIPLIAPTTTNDRVRQIGEKVTGFVYCMSVKGITGARQEMATDLDSYLERVRQHTDLPIALGFGISRPEQVRQLSSTVDGIVIGSRLIYVVEEAIGENPEAPKPGWQDKICDFVREMAEAVKR